MRKLSLSCLNHLQDKSADLHAVLKLALFCFKKCTALA